MKNIKTYFLLLVIGFTSVTILDSCKKGEDDPALSLRSRRNRFANTWTLTKYEKNGERQNIDGSTFRYEAAKSGRLVETVEGAVFGFPTKSVKDGSWEFINDKEDVKIEVDGRVTNYNIQRLAGNELWLKELKGSDTHIYFFEGNID